MTNAEDSPPPTSGENTNSPTQQPSSSAAPPARSKGRWSWLLRRAAVLGLIVLVLGIVGIGAGEYYTSRPEFCGSCHIMEPYFTSWSHDKHGKNLNVKCVDCHYAPGEKFTFSAKFKGLSQATSYFSGRAGTGRPRAHVSDASCLTSGCHGNADYLKEVFLIGSPRTEKRFVLGQEVEVNRTPTVRFAHDKHLNIDARLADADRRLAQIRRSLNDDVGDAAWRTIQGIVVSVGAASERSKALHDMLADLEIGHVSDDAFELMRLEHEKTRLKQLGGLTCASCHSYDESGKNHLTVNLQTCYTCHFTNESFNRGTASCLTCHEPPVRSILIHAGSSAPSQSHSLMNHVEIVARGIECSSCHLDVVQGQSIVTARDCKHCHDQDRYLVNFENRTTAEVEEYHEVHVAAQRANCTDCHHPVEHKLIEPTQVASSAGFMKSVVDDCQHCHPSHHEEQVQLLMGTGGAGVAETVPNAMFGSRVNCQGCHTKSGTDFKGAPLIEATKATCIVCHGEDYEELFDQWVSEIAASLNRAGELLADAEQRVEALRGLGKPVPESMEALLSKARHDIHFIRAGNGVHNKNYALQLLDVSILNLKKIIDG